MLAGVDATVLLDTFILLDVQMLLLDCILRLLVHVEPFIVLLLY